MMFWDPFKGFSLHFVIKQSTVSLYLPLLFSSKGMSIQCTEYSKCSQKEEKFTIDEFVQTPSPHKEETSETSTGGGCHFILVAHCHCVITRQHTDLAVYATYLTLSYLFVSIRSLCMAHQTSFQSHHW